ncbi:MAG: hypothetical protein ABIF09_17440 [Gemmatimonadota bacterium]
MLNQIYYTAMSERILSKLDEGYGDTRPHYIEFRLVVPEEDLR